MTAANISFVGSLKTEPIAPNQGKSTGTDDFSKIFAKSASDAKMQNPKSDGKSSEPVKAKDSVAEPKADEKQSIKGQAQTETQDNTKTIESTDSTKNVEDGEDEAVTEEIASVLGTAIMEIVNTIEEVMEVPQEDVESAMEALDMQPTDLLTPEGIKQLAVALTQDADELSLMTDEHLFQDVMEITQKVNEVVEKIADTVEVTKPELENALLNSMPVPVEAPVIPKETNEKPQLTVEALQTPEASKEVELPVTQIVEEATSTKEEQPKNNHKEAQTQVDLTQTVLKQIENAVEKVNETSTVSYTADTQDIMNQITDAMKLTMKEDITEMELQLHPASLGNVRVQVAAKDGVITASFTTQNETVKAALESQMVTLKENMNEQGIKVENVEVTVASHAFERNLNEQGEGSRGNSDLMGKKKGTRRINLSALLEETDEIQLEEEDKIVADMMKKNGNTVDYTA